MYDKTPLLNEVGLAQLLGSIRVQKARTAGSNQLWVQAPSSVMEKVVLLAGLDRSALLRQSSYPGFYIEPFPALIEALNHGIYPVSARTADDHYFLRITENNRLWIQYQQILGSRFLADLTDAMVEAMIMMCASQLMSNGVASSPAKTSMPTSGTITAEMQLLFASDNRINLPKTHLHHYADIKATLVTAGGRYNSKGFFSFPAGIDTAAVLDAVRNGETVNQKKDYQFFATPPALASVVCDEAGDLRGCRVLEPSAGDGVLADIARNCGAEVVTIETWSVNAIRLREKGYSPIERDFLTVTPAEIGLFDVVLANPPFTRNQDIDHVLHMFEFLKPGGILSVVMSTAWQNGEHKKHVAFREHLEALDVVMEPVPAGTFKASGTTIAAVRLVIRKPPADLLLAA